jgi:hypothetical protein
MLEEVMRAGHPTIADVCKLGSLYGLTNRIKDAQMAVRNRSRRI